MGTEAASVRGCFPITVREGLSFRRTSSSSNYKDVGLMLVDNPLVEILTTPLDLQRYYSACEDSGCGAIATFSGVTRDNFQGKRTVKLEYEAFIPMAETKLKVCVLGPNFGRWHLRGVSRGSLVMWYVDCPDTCTVSDCISQTQVGPSFKLARLYS